MHHGYSNEKVLGVHLKLNHIRLKIDQILLGHLIHPFHPTALVRNGRGLRDDIDVEPQVLKFLLKVFHSAGLTATWPSSDANPV